MHPGGYARYAPAALWSISWVAAVAVVVAVVVVVEEGSDERGR